MRVRVTRHKEFLPSHAALMIDVFRGLSAFRSSSDERVLQELFAKLCEHMAEDAADRVLSAALALDNEIRFRMPCGLSLREQGDDPASPHEKALIILVAHAE